MYPDGMTDETHLYRHSITGKVERLTEDQASVFPSVLERVPDDAKPYVPGMFKPGLVGEFDNPEPPTDSQESAQQTYDQLIEQGFAPNSTVVREAKKALDAANAEAEKALEEARLAEEADEKARQERLAEEQAAAAAAALEAASGQDAGNQAGQDEEK